MANLGLTIRVENLDRVREQLAKLSGQQARMAYANAINDAAKRVQAQMRAELKVAFDRPTKFIHDSPKYDAATHDKLTARVLPTMDSRNLPSKGGKVGIDPQYVLQSQEFGGRRRDKRSEVVLRRAGILHAGWQTAIPATPYPGSDDGRGNLRGAFLQQLLSYLQAFSEQGFKANMTGQRKRAIHRGTKKTTGRRYFVSYGKWRDGRSSHLAPGIWAASGTGGVDVRPVLMFVRTPSYQPRISMERIAKAADLQDYLDRRVRARIRNLAEGKLA